MKITHKSDYRKRRRENYPELVEFADAMYWAEQGDRSLLEAYFTKVSSVKQQYPKPARGSELPPKDGVGNNERR